MNKINMVVIGYDGMGAGFHARRAVVIHEQMVRVRPVMEECFCSAQSGQAVNCRI